MNNEQHPLWIATTLGLPALAIGLMTYNELERRNQKVTQMSYAHWFDAKGEVSQNILLEDQERLDSISFRGLYHAPEGGIYALPTRHISVDGGKSIALEISSFRQGGYLLDFTALDGTGSLSEGRMTFTVGEDGNCNDYSTLTGLTSVAYKEGRVYLADSPVRTCPWLEERTITAILMQ